MQSFPFFPHRTSYAENPRLITREAMIAKIYIENAPDALATGTFPARRSYYQYACLAYCGVTACRGCQRAGRDSNSRPSDSQAEGEADYNIAMILPILYRVLTYQANRSTMYYRRS